MPAWKLAFKKASGEDLKARLDIRADRNFEPDGDWDDAQRQRLREITDRCPVYRTLDS